MGPYGWLELMWEIILGQLRSRIHPMESTGLRPVLEVRFLQTAVLRWDGVEQDGWLEAQEHILSPILPMESHGLGLLLVRLTVASAVQSHGMVQNGSLEA
jgi:hypothetical protein